MFIYYKIFSELIYEFGEVVLIHDPSLKRCWNTWLKKHIKSIALSEGYKVVPIKSIK